MLPLPAILTEAAIRRGPYPAWFLTGGAFQRLGSEGLADFSVAAGECGPAVEWGFAGRVGFRTGLQDGNESAYLIVLCAELGLQGGDLLDKGGQHREQQIAVGIIDREYHWSSSSSSSPKSPQRSTSPKQNQMDFGITSYRVVASSYCPYNWLTSVSSSPSFSSSSLWGSTSTKKLKKDFCFTTLVFFSFFLFFFVTVFTVMSFFHTMASPKLFKMVSPSSSNSLWITVFENHSFSEKVKTRLRCFRSADLWAVTSNKCFRTGSSISSTRWAISS